MACIRDKIVALQGQRLWVSGEEAYVTIGKQVHENNYHTITEVGDDYFEVTNPVMNAKWIYAISAVIMIDV
ncbi:MAG: hypothetical protein ACD_5C00183G0002 [uncultured bacterium]|nr:MAG: hypothetical protein ACD_5C00183G0002 [uncultured bacterium]KKQ59868.1 MAG: hypothetical protein US82_C0049G0005 [Parcubacteria group bacterium GW2011_GWC1_38_22]